MLVALQNKFEKHHYQEKKKKHLLKMQYNVLLKIQSH